LQSLEVSYVHLSREQPTLGLWVADYPVELLDLFSTAAHRVVLQMYEHYAQIHPEVFVRVAELPISDKLREIRWGGGMGRLCFFEYFFLGYSAEGMLTPPPPP
jgi:DNA replicative helicase MCM subunit Mcm2 (Cdc46/Mcm family)